MRFLCFLAEEFQSFVFNLRFFLLLESFIYALFFDIFNYFDLFLAAEFLFGSFFMIFLLTFSICSCIIFLILLNYPSVFSCNLLKFLLFLLLYLENHRSPYVMVTRSLYVNPLMMSCYLSFSCSLKFFAFLSSHIKEQSLPPLFTNYLWGRNNFQQLRKGFQGFLRPINTTAPQFLLPLLAEFLRLYACFVSCNALGYVLTASLLFSQTRPKYQVWDLSLAYRIAQLFTCTH